MKMFSQRVEMGSGTKESRRSVGKTRKFIKRIAGGERREKKGDKNHAGQVGKNKMACGGRLTHTRKWKKLGKAEESVGKESDWGAEETV